MHKYILNTPAKINLFLQVNNRNSHNYHEIETIFLPLKDIFDTIKMDFNTQNKIIITSNNRQLPSDENNLCHKAAELYCEQAGLSCGVDIYIEKNIPIAAGMGGGSSDAATVLLVLQKEYNAYSESELLKLAVKLGADVPFFLSPVPSTGYGVGELLNPIQVGKNFHVIICAPNFPVSSSWAYKHLKRKHSEITITDCVKSLSGHDLYKISRSIKNDLAYALYEKFPVLQILKDALIDAGAFNAEITGSGPTIFGICENKRQADSIVNRMKQKFSAEIEYKISSIL